MRAGHPEARSAGVSEVVGSGRYRTGGSAETGGGLSTKIRDGDRVRGVFGGGEDRGRRREGPGQFPVQGSEEDHMEETAATEGRELGKPTAGGGNEGGRNIWDTDIYCTEAE